jgi:hypothetical protein
MVDEIRWLVDLAAAQMAGGGMLPEGESQAMNNR